ncbi:MAG TPA: hypothetical protein VGL44_10375 [Gaiellales bacterium]|jgi:hypothetical protein
MRITIDCPECNAAKRPLQTCAACGAAGRLEDLTAWRLRLHAHHMAVITARPRRETPDVTVRMPRPLHVVVQLDELIEATETMIVPDTVAPPPNPLSFDWDDHRGIRRLRKSA